MATSSDGDSDGPTGPDRFPAEPPWPTGPAGAVTAGAPAAPAAATATRRGRRGTNGTADTDRRTRKTGDQGAERPPRERLPTRILPRSVLGIASLILALAVGAGFSGVVLFSYYQYKLNQTNDRVNTLISGYKKQFANAEGDLAAAAAAARPTSRPSSRPSSSFRPGRPPWPP